MARLITREKLTIYGLFFKREYEIELDSFNINNIYFEFKTVGKNGLFIENIIKNRWFQKITVEPIYKNPDQASK